LSISGIINSVQNDLIADAIHGASDCLRSLDDTIAILNLRADNPPSEQLISSIKVSLNGIVAEIETRLLQGGSTLMAQIIPKTWEVLRQAGFLSDRELVDSALAHFSSMKLNQALHKNGRLPIPEQLLARLVVDKNGETVRLAKVLLHDIAKNDGQIISLDDIPTLAFRRLVWRIVGVLQMLQEPEDIEIRRKAASLIDEHSHSISCWRSAVDLHSLTEQQYGAELSDPQQVGLALFTAHMENISGLSQSHILELLSGSSILPTAILLHKAGVDQQSAIETIFVLRGFEIKPGQVQHLQNSYASLQNSTVDALLANWSKERTDWLGNELDRT
jgi:hypothetical protein